MKTKKAKVIIPMVIIIVGIICVCLFIGNRNSIIGEWKIDSFVFEDEIIPFDKYGEYYGVDNQKAYSYLSITFTNKNVAIIMTPEYESRDSRQIECTYIISNNIITLTSNDESIEALKINKNTLESLDSDFLMEGYIFTKQ